MKHQQEYKSVLTLLRSGALEQAEKEYYRLGLHAVKEGEDILALGGRLLKTKALECLGEERASLAYKAGVRYHDAYRDTGGTYTGINTASMYLVGGNERRAIKIAEEVLIQLRSISPKPGEDAYYHMATVAEAKLVLGDLDQAITCLNDALQLDPHNFEAHATTIRQFEMLLASLDKPDDWLQALRPPKTLHFAGHIFGLAGSERAIGSQHIYALERAIEEALKGNKIGFAYGALAAGSDIMIAEKLLGEAIELHVIMPCADELFLETSVAPYGEDWVRRFQQCREKASTVRYISQEKEKADNLRTAFASELAMGLACLKADQLATEALQLLVWDGTDPETLAGTARDAGVWKNSKRSQVIVPFPEERGGPTPSLENGQKATHRRELKAMLFADVRGFGALPDHKVPVFLNNVIKGLSAKLDSHRDRIDHLNTWGDGLFVVLPTVADAAEMALELQACFHAFDLKKMGLPEFLALRIGGHYGPVHEMKDAIMGSKGFYGSEVSYAARIEPLTVPGSVYVSEAFACALAVGHADHYRAESVGSMTPRKGSDPIKLFSLRKI